MRKSLIGLLVGVALAGCQPQSPSPANSTPATSPPSSSYSSPAASPVGATGSPAASPTAATPSPAASPMAAASGSPASAFSQKLEMAGTTFQVESANQGAPNKVTITPTGLEIDNAVQTVEVDGTVTGAEVSDLDVDGFPEVYVFIRGAGEGAPASLVAFASNKGKSLSSITLPPLKEVPGVGESYRGGDELAVLEGRLGQRFPAHGPDGKPTGKTKQIQWKLQPGEASWQLVVDQVMEF